MAGKKKTITASNSKPTEPIKPTTSTNTKEPSNGHSKNQQPQRTSSSASTGGVPVLVCAAIALLSLVCGLLSPYLLQAYHDQSTSVDAASRQLKKETTKITKTETSTPKMEFPCNHDGLAQVLHDDFFVQGMHVICMDQSMASLKLTLYPGAKNTTNPLVVELEGLPEWPLFKDTLRQHLRLRDMDQLHQPWAMYSPNGELLLQENNEHVEMAGLVRMGIVLLFQGGQFVWPGVRVGFQRTIDLYTVVPGATPQPEKRRTATLETLSLEPLVFSVEGFLDESECDFFQKEATPTLQYSQVTLMDMDQGRPASDFRTSQSTFLQKNNHETIRDIDYRTASLVRVPRFHQENVQVLRYGGGEKYDAHHDYFDKALYQNDVSTLKNFIQYGRRNRFITVFWYLSDVEEGGETIFPRAGGAPQPRNMADCRVGLKVKPVRGKVIIFYSLKPDGSLDPLSLHGACPVQKGIKWAANKWVWNAPIEFGSGR